MRWTYEKASQRLGAFLSNLATHQTLNQVEQNPISRVVNTSNRTAKSQRKPIDIALKPVLSEAESVKRGREYLMSDLPDRYSVQEDPVLVAELAFAIYFDARIHLQFVSVEEIRDD